MSTTTALLAYRPDAMTPARLAAVSYLARWRRTPMPCMPISCVADSRGVRATTWTRWSGSSEPVYPLYIRQLGECGLMVSTVNTMMHGVRGYFRFAHIDGMIPADPAVHARLPKVHRDESRTQG